MCCCHLLFQLQQQIGSIPGSIHGHCIRRRGGCVAAICCFSSNNKSGVYRGAYMDTASDEEEDVLLPFAVSAPTTNREYTGEHTWTLHQTKRRMCCCHLLFQLQQQIGSIPGSIH